MVDIFPHIYSYQQFIDELPVAACTCDQEGYIQLFNEKAVRLFGRAPAPGTERWTDFWKEFQEDGSGLELNKFSPVEALLRKPDGQRRHVRIYNRPISGPDRKPAGSIHIITDITKDNSEEEGTTHRAFIVQSSDDAILSITLEGIVKSWNEAATRIFGYTAEEIIGQPVTKLLPPDRLDEEPAILEHIKKGQRVEHFETKRLTKCKRLIDISLTISPVKDSAGNIIGASKIARDISEQKNMARVNREREELFRMAVESTNIGSWEFYPRTSHFIVSDESRKIWGIEREAVISIPYLQHLVHENDWEMLRRSALHAMAADGKFQAQFRIYRADTRELRWVKVQGIIFFSENREPERFIGTMLDITTDKTFTDRLEEIVNERTRELITLNEQLRRSNDELEQFAYIASHDLQEPMRKVQTFAELIERNLGEPELLERYAGRIKASSARMIGLIRDVLDFSRLSKVAVQLQEVDLNLVLREAMETWRPEMEKRNAALQSDPLPVIRGNADQLYQLFHNLISNSLKFCEKPPLIHISVSRLHHQQVMIVFRDNGIGFEQKYAEKIFHIFSHLNAVEQYSGTGIGLALCRKIVENHGGTITATGIPREGATFFLSFPL